METKETQNTKLDRVVYKGWLTVIKRKINDKQYDVLKLFDAVGLILTNNRNEILLVKQFRPSVMKDTWEIPAGCLDKERESIESCLIREVEEEASIQLKEKQLKRVTTYHPAIGFSDNTLHIFKAKIRKQKLKEVNDADVTEIKWVKIKHVKKMIDSGEICDAKTIFSYYYLKSNTFLNRLFKRV